MSKYSEYLPNLVSLVFLFYHTRHQKATSKGSTTRPETGALHTRDESQGFRSQISVRKECEALKKKGWLKFEVARSSSIIIIPTAPTAVQTRLATDLTEYRRFWAWFGESMMKVMLDNTVQSSNCLDNCRPQRMSNPETGKALELDRLYYPNIAFEFQGRQHHQLTPLHRDEQQFERARLLDLAKIGLGTRLDIEIVEITVDDLTIDGIIAKIPNALEIQPID